MSDSTLLAHLSARLRGGSENLATEALEYVLRNPLVSDAFQRHLRQLAPSLPAMARYRTQVRDASDTGIRDLVGSTDNGITSLVVEVKFDAPLTSNQPGTYLKALREVDGPSLLVFLVPTSRAEALWPRLMRRCAESEVHMESEGRHVARSGTVTLAVTTWNDVLDAIGGIPLGPKSHQVLAEIDQLRGLCDRQDREGFVPFSDTFLEGDSGRYLEALDSLLIDAINLLREEHLVETVGYKWTAGQGWFGKYFKMAEVLCLLHVNYARWASQADTPLWLNVDPQADPRISEALEPLRLSEPRQLFDGDGQLAIPVHVPAGKDREHCLDEIIAMLKDVRSLLDGLQAQIDSDLSDPGPPAETVQLDDPHGLV